ncbi:PD-(D/E)XK nuclease family protein [bacterium]|nr:PD-(D/E)XK nuclease family protein [bacterium]MBU3955185.1 PD-(D/E)XK nuclease family protein [bacterium]
MNIKNKIIKLFQKLFGINILSDPALADETLRSATPFEKRGIPPKLIPQKNLPPHKLKGDFMADMTMAPRFQKSYGKPKLEKIAVTKRPLNPPGASPRPGVSATVVTLQERDKESIAVMSLADSCPYCSSKDIIKRGLREKKFETQQVYFCNSCKRKFTPQKIKGKKFPLAVIFDGLNFYNTGFTLEKSCHFLKEKYGLEVKSSTLADWVKEFEPLCRYSRMREYGLKLFSPNQVIKSVRLFHRQVFDFKYHQAKIALILQDYKHYKFEPLREFLDIIAVECPHQLFKDSPRASEEKRKFDLSGVIISEKHNFACRIAEMVLQSVKDNKLRHSTLQRFMLANDSVTIACETPIYMDSTDIEHMKDKLKFSIPFDTTGLETITGHIDIIQLRNGAVHILDYKPNAGKQKPIEQLTLYALALSRLTGLRLFHMKCAWFDEKSYFEFFPLHVVLKKGRKKPQKEDPDQLRM